MRRQLWSFLFLVLIFSRFQVIGFAETVSKMNLKSGQQKEVNKERMQIKKKGAHKIKDGKMTKVRAARQAIGADSPDNTIRVTPGPGRTD